MTDDDLSNKVKTIILIILPWILSIPPFSSIEMIVTLIGVLVAALIMGGGWENIEFGFIGGLVAYIIFLLVVPIFVGIFLYKKKSIKIRLLIVLVYFIYFAGVQALLLLTTDIKLLLSGEKGDYERLLVIQRLQGEVEDYWLDNNNLPKSINEIGFSETDIDVTKDPITREPIGYYRLEETKYQLCASFDKSGVLEYMVSSGSKIEKKKYEEGYSCLDFDARKYGYFMLSHPLF